MENKIIASVKFNDRKAYVFENEIKLTYYRFGSTIVGTNGVFYSCYYEKFERAFKAFGGRKFTLIMHDGELVECSGQWWAGISDDARILIDSDLIHTTASSKLELKKCYVFCGYYASKTELEKLINKCDFDYYSEYYDYEKVVKNCRPKKIIRKIFGEKKIIGNDNYMYEYFFINGDVIFNKRWLVDEKDKIDMKQFSKSKSNNYD